jgi:hypothetical protein
MNDLLNTFPSECFLTEPHLDVIENFGVLRNSLVQHVLEVKVSRTQAVAEMLSKDPAAIFTKTGISTQAYFQNII